MCTNGSDQGSNIASRVRGSGRPGTVVDDDIGDEGTMGWLAVFILDLRDCIQLWLVTCWSSLPRAGWMMMMMMMVMVGYDDGL